MVRNIYMKQDAGLSEGEEESKEEDEVIEEHLVTGKNLWTQLGSLMTKDISDA